MYMKKLLIVVVLLLLPVLPLQAEPLNGIAAVVNKEIITNYQLDQALQQVLPAQITAADRERLRREVLDSLVEEVLIRQRTEELDLRVGEEELEAAIRDVQRQNNLSREQLEEAVAVQGMAFNEYRENLRKQILRFKLLGRDVQSKLEVTNQELREYYQNNSDQFQEMAGVRLGRITFRLPAGADAERQGAVRAEVERARTMLAAGDSIATVLETYSSWSGVDGGDMGLLAASEISSAFAQAIEGLPPGGVSAPVVMGDAFHLLKVIERHAGGMRPFEMVKDDIRHKLVEEKQDAGYRSWAQGLRKGARIDIRI
jgi:peptidyl-prolyl cis-trans isomerase SurA